MNTQTSVPSPWSPVAASEQNGGCVSSVWGRTYKQEKNLLLSSVVSLGDELLASPINIAASENGSPITWRDTDVFLGEHNDEKAIFYATAQSEAFIVNTATTVEFDGLCTVDVKLMPRGYTVPQLFGLEKNEPANTHLDYFHIEIPIKKQFAGLYHVYPSSCMPSPTGDASGIRIHSGSGVVPDCGMRAKFSSVLFLGSDEKGFFTYAESDEPWEPEDPRAAVEFENLEDRVVMRLHLLDGQPKKWAERAVDKGQYVYPDICFRLAFQATPVKPFPKNPYKQKQLHIDCFKKLSNDYDEFLANPVVEGSDEIGYDRIKRLGVTTLILHEKWNQIQNYWNLTDRTANRLRTIISECHARGIRVVPYFGYEISTMSDIWFDKSERYKRMGSDNKHDGLFWYRFPAQRERPVCYNSPISEEFTAGLERLVDEFDFDGVYLDGTGMVWDCCNTSHGCGYRDENGVLHHTFPIFGVRRTLRRIYEIFNSRGKTVDCHVSDCVCPAGVSFAHSLWLGEYIQYSLVREGASEMPKGYLRATHSGRNFGLPTEFIIYENRPIWGFDDGIAFSLVHGILPRPNDIGRPLEQMSEIWAALDRFPIDSSEWVAYFSGKMPYKAESEAVCVSGYRAENEWLLFVANAETAPLPDCRLSGFSSGDSVEDAITGEPIEISGGSIPMPLVRFGHAILRVKLAK